MAVDESLLHLSPIPVLRLYGWEVAAVSIGYFQSWKLVPPNRPFVRRYTGGGLVDHSQDFTYTVVAPRDSSLGALSTAESYALIHRAIARAMQALDLAAELTSDCAEIDAPGCFQKPVKFDVMLHQRKVAGGAQRRTRRAMLQQGSILLPDPGLYPSLQKILPKTLGHEIGLTWQESALSQEETAQATALARDRYSQHGWNQER
jgi:lipoate-protein ligase A